MSEVPLNEATDYTNVLVVPESLEVTETADWTWVPSSLPGQFWPRPYAYLRYVPASERNWMMTIIMEEQQRADASVDLDASTWRFNLQNAGDGGCMGNATSAREGQLSSAQGLSGAVLLVAPEDFDRAVAEFNRRDYTKYAVVSVPGLLKTSGNTGPTVTAPVA